MSVDTSYRDYYANAASAATDAEKTSANYNAVFTSESKTGVSVDDFLNLMIAQLKSQDFMNPVDDTQYVTQLAQFATMQQMQEMAAYMKTNYVLSLVGQNVTAARFTVSGAIEKETGPIEKVSIVDNEHVIYVNGKKFTLAQIMEYHNGTPAASTPTDGDGDEK